jgi:hypothetical protein
MKGYSSSLLCARIKTFSNSKSRESADSENCTERIEDTTQQTHRRFFQAGFISTSNTASTMLSSLDAPRVSLGTVIRPLLSILA